MRENNEIPAVLYGGEKVVHFTVTNDAVRKLIYTPEIFVVELTIDGNKSMAIVKDLQFQPVTDALLHIDFLEVFPEKPVVMEVPVALEGHAEGVKAGGKLTLQMRKLKVKATYGQIPEKLVINVDAAGRRFAFRGPGVDEREERRGLRRSIDACRPWRASRSSEGLMISA